MSTPRGRVDRVLSRLVVVTVGVAALTTALAGAEGHRAARASTAPVDVAVLGDSYVSGEGLPSASGDCGTAEDAWGAVVARALGDPDPDVVACTGAGVADVTVGGDGRRAQVDEVTAPVDVAILVVGGNDLGFAEILLGCFDVAELDAEEAAETFGGDARDTAWSQLVGSGAVTDGCDVDGATAARRLDAFADPDRFPLPGGGRGDLAAVHTAVADRVLAPDGTLLVVGYPSLFADPATWPSRYGRRCHGILAADAAAFADGTEQLVGAIADAATRAAASDPRIVFVDVTGAVAAGDHGLCGPGAPWLNGLTLVEGGVDLTRLLGALLEGGQLDPSALDVRPTSSFHPNTAGHAGLADAVLDATTGVVEGG